ncbi:MAG TPA: transposase [Roseiarcus sp.]|nr:transposase [Roseiarcus sp.]
MQGKVSPEPSATRVYVGIDVCKARLDVFIHPVGQRLTVGNDPDGVKKLKRSLTAHNVALVVMEATGKYHRAAHRSLHAGGFSVAVVNPLRSRLFAEAAGALAKTDGLDARMLAILGESLDPAVTPPPSELLESLQELVHGRASAIAERTAVLNQLGASKTQCLIRELKRQLRAFDASIANLDAEIARLIQTDRDLARRLAILTSIPGVGDVTAIALIAGLQELGALSAKQVAMLAGLAPIACDTGETKGARHIKGGRAHVRRALYMAAVSASRCNPALSHFYQRLIASGKEAKVALTAVMRKLAILANTLVRENQTWTPNLP